MKQTFFICAILMFFTACQINVETNQDEQAKTLIDFFQPFEQQAPLVSVGVWGHEDVLPRDTANGLEDKSVFDEKLGKNRPANWCYWDGSIVKDDEGKYHMYASRWEQSWHHGQGWTKGSKAMHSVSDHLYGPYNDLGEAWPQWNNSKGHNVIGLRMHDGRYALVASEVVPGQVFVSDSPYGPFELLGEFKIDPNGYYPGWGRYNELDDGALRGGGVGNLANVMIILRPDGRYMMIARHCVAIISDDGILGPYKMMSDKAWLGVKDMPQFKNEDPTVWYSDSLYHIVVNHYQHDRTYHLTSEDGMHNWKNRGLAYSNDHGVFRHKDGTQEKWFTVQRPTVYTENNEVKAFNFSVIDVHKGDDAGNDENGSKVMVVPFDGAAFGRHMRNLVDTEHKTADATPPPTSWQSVDIGTVHSKGNAGYDEVVNTIRIKATGNRLDEKTDAFHFTYQKMSGDVSTKVFLLSDEISGGDIQSGLMMRKSLDAGAPFVLASFTKNGKFTYKQRANLGEKVSKLKTANLQTPYWVRLDKKANTITCYTSTSNRMNWDFMGETELDLGDEFYVGMASTSNGAPNKSLARFKNADAHNYGHPAKDGIVMHTFPDTIPSSGIIEFEAEIESVRTADVWVELECVQNGEKYKVLRKRYWKSGKQKLVYDAGKPLNPKHSYWFVIKAVQMHFHDSEHMHAGFKKVFVK
ncbi:glycoside hydrolase family protein [Labilibacter marinus]|uniref:glycoside hydrolase family protein n=1 Tax=Labilibacter marinus TaxID=1477105 RepID=UPI001179D6C6|nr:glycoside hydrolase family protein [Labilibacter marinus]